ncbi:MAG: alkaline phosphatase D family protein, partial [Acidobacteriota bacterium]|nr:alkaline phosphatase D family protein [Acidobacteriota bacterium]
RFELSRSAEFRDSRLTGWLDAKADNDFIVKTVVDELEPGTRYHYRLVYGAGRESVRKGPVRTFRTLDGAQRATAVRFVVASCMNYTPFQVLYEGEDRHLGYPALASILARDPAFVVFTGDSVYYDSPNMTENTPEPYRREPAKTAVELRAKWHEQLAQPRFVDLFARVPTYWEKDDHDYRYNDADNTGEREPRPELGRRIFREQVPVVDPLDSDAVTYRTHRVNRHLQIWLTENRDYRSRHMMEPGPGKSIWGHEQRQWLQRTLLESDADFKIVISSTPMIGPDDLYQAGPQEPPHDRFKRDNHSNERGFRWERDDFFAWLLEAGIDDVLFVNGDRHWQYHSRSPEGFEELSCGALHDENSRLGRLPGDPQSNDPDAEIEQLYLQQERSGGFLEIGVARAEVGSPPRLEITFYDEHGEVLHNSYRTAADVSG